MAKPDLNPTDPQPADNVFEEQENLPMPRTPASGQPSGGSKQQSPHVDAERDLATAEPGEAREPGTKPDRNTM